MCGPPVAVLLSVCQMAGRFSVCSSGINSSCLLSVYNFVFFFFSRSRAASALLLMAPPPPTGFTSEQLEPLEQWFESCNGAQQAAVALKLLSRANPKAAHLIHSFLQQRLLIASAIWRQEIAQANDPGKDDPLPRRFSFRLAMSYASFNTPLVGTFSLSLAFWMQNDDGQGDDAILSSPSLCEWRRCRISNPALLFFSLSLSLGSFPTKSRSAAADDAS